MNQCATCRFWGWPQEWESNPDPDADVLRDCQLFSDWPYDVTTSSQTGKPDPRPELKEKLAHVCPWAGADGGSLATGPTFGCVQWEAR